MLVSRRAFTLIELLVVVAVIAILSIILILVLNPAELLAEARDANRVSNVVRSPSWMLTEYNNELSPSTFYSMGSEL